MVLCGTATAELDKIDVTHAQLKEAKYLVNFADAHNAVLGNVLLDLR
jgi:hypothetical protein